MTHPAFWSRPGIAAAAACTGLLAAACSGSAARTDAGSSRPLTSASASAHAAPSVLPATTPASAPSSSEPAGQPSGQPSGPGASGPAGSIPVGTGGTGGPAPVPQCATLALRVSIGPANGAAGSIYYPLEFTNISGATCTMYGYPGVSFVASPGGSQLGGPAVRDPAFSPSLVRLLPGAVAHASLQVVIAANYPAAKCKPVTAHYLRIYPPDQFTPRYLAFTARTCTGAIPGGSTLGIFVVRPGATGP